HRRGERFRRTRFHGAGNEIHPAENRRQVVDYADRDRPHPDLRFGRIRALPPFFSLSSPKEERVGGEEPVVSKIKPPHPGPLPVWRGEWVISMRCACQNAPLRFAPAILNFEPARFSFIVLA